MPTKYYLVGWHTMEQVGKGHYEEIIRYRIFHPSLSDGGSYACADYVWGFLNGNQGNVVDREDGRHP